MRNRGDMRLAFAVCERRSWQDRFADWVTRRQTVARHEIELHRGRIYILPTAYGYVYAVALLIMLLSALNYNNSMAFMMTFLLAGLGANAMWHTQRNLLHLRIRQQGAQPVFAGDMAEFHLSLHNPTRSARQAVMVQWHDSECSITDLAAGETASTTLKVPAPRRGILRPRRFVIHSRFPLGLLRAWSWLEFEMSTLVYPAPAQGLPPLPSAGNAASEGHCSAEGHDDYAGLRDYQAGDSPRHIAWKLAARNDVVLTKQFSGSAHPQVWLDWHSLSEDDDERRLSILCGLILQARALQVPYGLRLPGKVIPPQTGSTHERQCLQALALYGLSP